jgi:hypothetical protein
MTPQEKLDSVIKSIELLKVLYGENLAQLPDEYKLGYAATLIDVHRQLNKESSPQVNDACSPVQSTLTEPVSSFNTMDLIQRGFNTMDLIQRGASSGLLLSPKEIAEQLYDVTLDEVNIRDLNKLVVEKWRDKYKYTSKIRPCRNNKMCSYLYFSVDWDLVGQALFQLEVRANIEAINK